MIAYLFWHIPREGIEADDYEDGLRAFHEHMRAAPPDGFSRSAVLRHYALPWAPQSMFVYEDWYLVEDFAALGSLNAAAVDAARKLPHDAIAAKSDWGAGAVYAPHAQAALTSGFNYWMSKPDDLGYEAFYDVVGSQLEPLLWRRQMVLGPAPEFCLMSAGRVDLPGIDVFESAAREVFPG